MAMHSRYSRIVRSGAFVTAGLAVELGCQFARTMFLAHVLDAAEFGLVASVNAVFAFVEMGTAISVDRYLVFSRNGDSKDALDVAHTLSVLRGLLLGVIVIAVAQIVANLVTEPSLVDSLTLVAAIPVIRACAHLGVIQMQRTGVFWLSALPEAVGGILGLLASVVAALLVADHRAIVWGLGVQAVGMVVCSHLLAGRLRFRLSFDHRAMGAALRYCLPLAANGLALAVAYQLDRLIVGIWLGVVALGVYSLFLTVLLQPVSMAMRLITTMAQPHLSSAWHSDPSGRFRRMVHWIVDGCSLMGLSSATGVICLGGPVWILVFGTKYAVDDLDFVLLGLLLFVRSMRGCENLIGLAVGNTVELMLANAVGCVGPLVGSLALGLKPVIGSALLGVLVADIVSLVVLSTRLRTHLGVARTPIMRALIRQSAVPCVLGGWVMVGHPGIGWRLAVPALVCVIASWVMVRRYMSSGRRIEHSA